MGKDIICKKKLKVPNVLRGEKIELASIKKKDLGRLMKWRNNPEFRKHFREYRVLDMKHQKRWYEEAVLQDPATIMFSINRLKDHQLLGCCGLVYISWPYKHADLSLYIGWNNSYIDKKGYAEESAKLLMNYGFNELCLNKIWTEIYIFDKKKKKLYDKFDFNIDGVLRENYFHKGKFWDSYILSVLASEWRLNKYNTTFRCETNNMLVAE